MGWFKKLANKARESNAEASNRFMGYSNSSSYSKDDEDEEYIHPVCLNCVSYTMTGNYCCLHGVYINCYVAETHGCEEFFPD